MKNFSQLNLRQNKILKENHKRVSWSNSETNELSYSPFGKKLLQLDYDDNKKEFSRSNQKSETSQDILMAAQSLAISTVTFVLNEDEEVSLKKEGKVRQSFKETRKVTVEMCINKFLCWNASFIGLYICCWEFHYEMNETHVNITQVEA